MFTREWREKERHEYRVCASEVVERELRSEPFPGQAEALRLLANTAMLAMSDEIRGTGLIYRRHLLMPDEAVGDALHLAIASVFDVDYLLTWNCKHLANPNKTRHIQTINLRLGLRTPTILTPQMLCGGDNYETIR